MSPNASVGSGRWHPVALLAHYASGGAWPWLAEQTYLEPFPAALRLGHSVPA